MATLYDELVQMHEAQRREAQKPKKPAPKKEDPPERVERRRQYTKLHNAFKSGKISKAEFDRRKEPLLLRGRPTLLPDSDE